MRYFPAAVLILAPVWTMSAAELMPVPQQNALVQKYCAVCHTDAAKNGGLTLQHFNAATAPPSLKAMMLSKMTGGALISIATKAASDANAAALVGITARTGAMGAAGIPIPDKDTIGALVHAFAVGSAGAAEWNVEHSAGVTAASVAREMPSATKPGQAEIYRLIASCNASSHEGGLQLVWSPVAQRGTLTVVVDAHPARQYAVGGDEAMGNGSGLILHGAAALMIPDPVLPAESFVADELFPGEKVTFAFAGIPRETRKELSVCFAGSH